MEMEKYPSSDHLANAAMTYGTYMGLFWIAKFALIPFIFSMPVTSLLFMGLTIAVPFVGYHFAQHYRKHYCPEGQLPFMRGWIFCMSMYFFASLLVAIAHYVFFRYIDQGALLGSYSAVLDQLIAANTSLAQSLESNRQALDLIRAMSPIDLTIQLLINNLFYGMMMALPTALVVAMASRREQQQRS